MSDRLEDPDLGALIWNPQLEWWEGSIRLQSGSSFVLYVLARERASPGRRVSTQAREAISWARRNEERCREYAARELLQIQQDEWSEGVVVTGLEFASRLVPESLEVHESGYMEMHFEDDGLFWGHAVGVRVRPGGAFQEAVIEG